VEVGAPEWLTLPDAARQFDVPLSIVRRLTATDRVRSRRDGGSILVRTLDLADYLAGDDDDGLAGVPAIPP
jgi:hypothetical protein